MIYYSITLPSSNYTLTPNAAFTVRLVLSFHIFLPWFPTDLGLGLRTFTACSQTLRLEKSSLKLEVATLGNQNSIEAIVQSISKLFNCKVVMDGHMPQHH
jgi:hypothetical protein